MEKKPKIVITLPAYNAERTLERTVSEIPDGVREELILVDDASPDNTAALARSLGIRVHVHPQNRGYGGNQKTCYTMALQSGADVVVLLHPDYQYEPKAIPLLLAPILAGDADMTFGSRFAGLGNPRAGGMPAYRYFGNRLTTITQNFVLGTRFSEMHSGMRAYTRECLLSLPFLSYPDDFVFDAELLIDAVTGGQRVVEVPIPTRYTKESSSIAVGPSLRYVLGGLRHSLSRARTRGRRRGRLPVNVAPSVSFTSPRFSTWLRGLMSAYATSGEDARVLGAPPDVDEANIAPAKTTSENDLADTVVTFLHGGSPSDAKIEDALSVLRPEGLLIVVGGLPANLAERVTIAGLYAGSRKDARAGKYSVAVARAGFGHFLGTPGNSP